MIRIPTSAARDYPDRLVARWISADGHASINVDGVTTTQALQELLDSCEEEWQRQNILAGFFVIITEL